MTLIRFACGHTSTDPAVDLRSPCPVCNPDIPKVVSSSTFTVFGVELKCHVLSNGQRVIEADSMQAFMAALEHGTVEVTSNNASEAEFGKWLGGG